MKPPETHQQDSGLPLSTSALFADLVRRHNLAVNDLTETQLAEAIRQALPDFRRYVHANKQSVVYLPGQEAERWKAKCAELQSGLEQIQEKIRNIPDQTPPLMRLGMMVGSILANAESIHPESKP
jgi:hypothetical protein